jgi:hypothetical protein
MDEGGAFREIQQFRRWLTKIFRQVACILDKVVRKFYIWNENGGFGS